MSVVRRAMMRAALRSLVVCMGFCLMGLAIASHAAFAEGSSALGGTGGSSFESPLVVPGAQGLLGGVGVSEAEEARRDSPEAVVSRQESGTKYEGLGAEEAAKLAGEVFPAVVGRPAGGLPPLPEGQRITSFTGADSAQIDLGEGRRGVVQSTAPIATESAPGEWSPVDLGVSEAGGAFRIANPVVGVGIPKRLQEEVSLAGTGVSLVPVVNGSGAAAGGAEGRVDGSVVFYGGVGVGSDVDEFVKPETYGFSEDAVLRSAASPEQLFYRVGLPEGASLVQGKGGASGAVEVVDEGLVIASVLAPGAQDAAGTRVGVSLSVLSGDVLELTVDRGSGEYLFPIEVDPTVIDSYALVGVYSGETGNWVFNTDNKEAFEAARCCGGLHDGGSYVAKFTGGQYGYFEYPTQGESRVYELAGKASELDPVEPPAIKNDIALFSKAGAEEKKDVVDAPHQHD